MSDVKMCPCCGKEKVDEWDVCETCKWENDPFQNRNHDLKGGANSMSLNEAKEAYKNGEEVL